MRFMLDILSYGAACIVISILLSALLSCFLLFLSARASRSGDLPILAIFSGGILFLILTYQFATIGNAVKCKTEVLTVFDTVEMTIAVSGSPAAADIVDKVRDEIPVLGRLLNADMLMSACESVASLKETIVEKYDSFIADRIWWSVGAIVVFGGVMFVPGGPTIGSRRGRRRHAVASHRYCREEFE